ncbi:MAG: hypothetical protein ACRERV_05865, partial [Methylococcales bacterium]
PALRNRLCLVENSVTFSYAYITTPANSQPVVLFWSGKFGELHYAADSWNLERRGQSLAWNMGSGAPTRASDSYQPHRGSHHPLYFVKLTVPISRAVFWRRLDGLVGRWKANASTRHKAPGRASIQ